jgi:hypothetical protein
MTILTGLVGQVAAGCARQIEATPTREANSQDRSRVRVRVIVEPYAVRGVEVCSRIQGITSEANKETERWE